jgi:hypothetical protein
MFTRTKMIHGKPRSYLVASYRDRTGKVKQKTVLYLGSADSIRALKDAIRKQIRTLRQERDTAKRDQDWIVSIPTPTRRPVRGDSRSTAAYWWRCDDAVSRAQRKIDALTERLHVINQKTKDL